MNAEKKVVQWFVECGNAFSNEALAMVMAAHALGGPDSQLVSVDGTDGRPHSVWRIPGTFVARLRREKQGDRRYRFTFFNRKGPEGLIAPATFLERTRLSPAMKKARDRLAEVKEAQAAKSAG